jgi:hypothetical protein
VKEEAPADAARIVDSHGGVELDQHSVLRSVHATVVSKGPRVVAEDDVLHAERIRLLLPSVVVVWMAVHLCASRIESLPVMSLSRNPLWSSEWRLLMEAALRGVRS